MRHNHDIEFVPAAEPTHKVGYGKPPQHSQFKPGQSGNPRGRPKGSLNWGTLLDQALNEKVTVTEQGKSRKISKALAGATQLANRTAKGDLAALKLVVGWKSTWEASFRQGSDVDQPGPQPATSPGSGERELPDFEKMSTAKLDILMQAAWILDGKTERPPVPMPPEDPGDEPDDAGNKPDNTDDEEK